MSRTALPFHAKDISALARSLRYQLAEREAMPGHVELLNMLARSIGHRNFQQLRAQARAAQRLNTLPAEPEPVDFRRVARLARCYDATGCLQRWPGKQSERIIALWVLWSRLPAKEDLSEPEVNMRLQAMHSFGDHALLRRELCDFGLMGRTRDCRTYWRVEQRMPAEAVATLQHLKLRSERAAKA
ncbi:DUF2087 domain-containing protein [Microvirga terricola]|uniref:DUF2087 domain-containing protein n=1 Tax=Microvirga terricola TaxID=2719797 RepID=A0ABX0VCQ6_9HYPH|nr:DUF2087 domain-containing protein [Microvirga terricola]NIX77627.1 DUF2087 domain-containing protein [Microvirga terricola]